MSEKIQERLRELAGDWTYVDRHDFREAADHIDALEARVAELEGVENNSREKGRRFAAVLKAFEDPDAYDADGCIELSSECWDEMNDAVDAAREAMGGGG